MSDTPNIFRPDAPIRAHQRATHFPGFQVDRDIASLAKHLRMIDPFVGHKVRKNAFDLPIASYGLSSCGYDARLSPEIYEYAYEGGVIDAEAPPDLRKMPVYNDRVELRPGHMALGATVEHLKMPKSVFALCVGKSTWARIGIIVNVTPIEPGWQGHVTLEISNTNSAPVFLRPNQGIAQFIFYGLPETPERAYGDGKYQSQGSAPVGPKV